MDISLSVHCIRRIEEQRQDSADDVSDDDPEQNGSCGPDPLGVMLEDYDRYQHHQSYRQIDRRAEVLIAVASAE